MDASAVNGPTGGGSPEGEGGQGAPGPETGGTGFRRSAGSPRGEARKRDLLERVTDDLAANGLVDFSLRRAARAAGTTHKVLLYHFEGAEDLLRQAVGRLRDRRIAQALAAASGPPDRSLAERVRQVWQVLVEEEPGLSRVLDQAMGLAMYDRERYGGLSRYASGQYLPVLASFCPPRWPEPRRLEVAEMILATLRGFLLERSASGDDAGVAAGLEALLRALDREEAADGG
ncbi:TetR/AcrR family transcriptional regulator [Streptomyces sp. NPDC020917]|uniref:TetR/AcrR family transcriptional regulator n=1 Tax=Streptomyces sp. NPDC020917 TaxID=3365102 RepID=UPI00379EBD31